MKTLSGISICIVVVMVTLAFGAITISEGAPFWMVLIPYTVGGIVLMILIKKLREQPPIDGGL